jgi:hypothetical protein
MASAGAERFAAPFWLLALGVLQAEVGCKPVVGSYL